MSEFSSGVPVIAMVDGDRSRRTAL